jgi:glycerol-3-phosphate cytidylyltransferase
VGDGKVIGYTTGVYDLFHIGHLRLLERAAAGCDELVVGVTTDELCLEAKSKTPVVPYSERASIVQAIKGVDRVVPQTSMDKIAAWEEVRFHRMFVGDDWKGSARWNALEVEFAKVGVEIVYFPYTGHTSSSMLRRVLDGIIGGSAVPAPAESAVRR